MSNAAIRAGAAYVELGIRNKMERPLRNASARLKKFSVSVGAMGMGMAGLGAKVAAPLTLATRVFGGFDARMAEVAAITGATESQMAQLRDRAKELGATTKFSASQAAEGMKFLGMAGYKTEQILAGIPAVLSLAAAGGLELGTASDIASDVASAFGLTADEIFRVADVMAKTATSSNTSVEMMGETFKYLAPLAAAAGQTIEEAAAAVGMVANSGVKASMAGTDLALIMKGLGDSAVVAKLKSIGVATADSAGNLRDLSDIMRDVRAGTENMTEAKRLDFFAKTFSRAAKSAAILANASGQDNALGNLRDSLLAAGGASDAMAAKMSDNLGGDGVRILSNLEGVAIATGEALKEPLRSISNGVTAALTAVNGWVTANQSTVQTVALVAGVLLALGGSLIALGVTGALVAFVIGGLGTIFGALAGAVGIAGSAIAFLATPVGIALAAIVGLGAYMMSEPESWVGILQWFGDAWSGLSDRVAATMNAVLAALQAGDIAAATQILWQSINLEWMKGTNALRETWAGFVVWFKNSTDTLLTNALAKSGEMWATAAELAAKIFVEGSGTQTFLLTGANLMRQGAGEMRGESQTRNDNRFDEGAAAIEKLTAEIVAMQAALDARIAGVAPEPEALPSLQETLAAQAAAGGAAAAEKIQSALNLGTFSGFAADRLGGASTTLQERIADATEETAEGIDGLASAIRELEGLAFA